MTITRESAAAVLRLLTGAFPSPAITEDTARTYLDRMTSPPFGDVELLLATAEACVDTLDRMPSLHQLLVAYQGAARGKIAQRLAADQRALDAAGATTGGPRIDERYGAAMVDVIRTALSEAIPHGDGARGHRHDPGAECPVCSTADDNAARMRERMAELLAERHVVPIPQPVKVARCRHCGDDRVVTMVGVDPATDGACAVFVVKPCPECCPEASEAWANGDYGVRRGVTR